MQDVPVVPNAPGEWDGERSTPGSQWEFFRPGTKNGIRFEHKHQTINPALKWHECSSPRGSESDAVSPTEPEPEPDVDMPAEQEDLQEIGDFLKLQSPFLEGLRIKVRFRLELLKSTTV